MNLIPKLYQYKTLLFLMEKLLENLKEAEKTINTIDHILYVTFPIVNDKKILLKSLIELKIAVIKIINSILQYEYLFKRTNIYKDPKDNFRNFENNCSIRYNIDKLEINLIKELFDLVERHKKSSMEFVKDEKIIILGENMNHKTITLEKVKKFLNLSKNLLKKTKIIMKSDFSL